MKWFRTKERPETGPQESVESLGAREADDPVVSSLRERVESARLPGHALAAAREECDRLEAMEASSPEYSIGSNYLDFILSLPWGVSTRDDLDLGRAEEVLSARHSGLERVKERILEYLAVKSLHGRRNPRVMLVDDELIARENLSIICEHEGYDVTAVSNGLEAVAAMEQTPADLVVTDLKMEGMDGLELLGELRRRWPDTRVIMLTGYATVKTAVAAMRQGADQYMGKPVNLTKLRAHMHDLLQQGRRAGRLRGPVLCFTGPPGTGKTSIGRAIAEAMGRKFFRLSLAGLRDEAELRGHRRTYVGAMPGRILQGIRKAGAMNPVIMLDEMDKVIQDFQGDATSVLLEILDPEQNNAFGDNYLGLPFDLSGALFIATANGVERIPAPLRDRMEVIEFPSYTLAEKVEVATRYLIPAQLLQHGLDEGSVIIGQETLERLILDYTNEAGLRGLEQRIASLCRKVARQVLDDSTSGAREILPSALYEYLGQPPFFSTMARSEPKVGLATGLVWTENGGEVIFVEAARMRGNKQLILTGSLGEVLRESALTALSCIRSRADQFGVDPDFFESSDIHVHIPAGAVTKEGPSAGVTIAVSVLSLLTGRAVRQDVAVSGELSLLGDVLPVAGVREKLMAAARAGIRTVVLPRRNCDLTGDVTPEVLASLDVCPASTLEDVIEATLLPAEGVTG
jgi:ATP-dependent Lon protease